MKNGPDKKEESDVLPDDLLRDIEWLKGRAAPQQGVPVAASVLYPVSTAIKKANEEAMRNAVPGKEISGHGVFIGTWQPEGLSLKFNVFAAKEDLTDSAGKKEEYTYDDTVRRIAELKNWHGFDGTNYANDKELYEALKDGSYIKDGGNWFIPPRELLTGTEADGDTRFGLGRGKVVQPDNLYDHKDKGALSGSFYTVTGFHDCYWSSTEKREFQVKVRYAVFSTGSEYESWSPKDKKNRASCRPVRLELIP